MNQQLASLMAAMAAYDHGDAPRIQHFVKVHNFAATIGLLEGLDSPTLFTLEAAAILHDIGIYKSEALYGNSSGKHQEELGPAEARKLMNEVGGFTEEQIARVEFLIAHHHTYTGVDAPDWQILLEADYLVNAFEDNLSSDAIRAFEQKVFCSPTGKHLLEEMFLHER